MKVTYIYHSSFAVELEKSMLIFDYYGKGDLPERPAGKQVYFLNSHSAGAVWWSGIRAGQRDPPEAGGKEGLDPQSEAGDRCGDRKS